MRVVSGLCSFALISMASMSLTPGAEAAGSGFRPSSGYGGFGPHVLGSPRLRGPGGLQGRARFRSGYGYGYGSGPYGHDGYRGYGFGYGGYGLPYTAAGWGFGLGYAGDAFGCGFDACSVGAATPPFHLPSYPTASGIRPSPTLPPVIYVIGEGRRAAPARRGGRSGGDVRVIGLGEGARLVSVQPER